MLKMNKRIKWRNTLSMIVVTSVMGACGGKNDPVSTVESEVGSPAEEIVVAEGEDSIFVPTGPGVVAIKEFQIRIPVEWSVIDNDERSLTVGVDDEHQVSIAWHEGGYEKAVAAVRRDAGVVDLGEQAIGSRSFLFFAKEKGFSAFSKTGNGYVEVVGKNVSAQNEAMKKILATLKMEKE